jgi:hypothetical protein
MIERISITPGTGGAWTVKHREGVLGFTRTEDEALTVGRDLVQWLSSRGRAAELHVERSFAPLRHPASRH